MEGGTRRHSLRNRDIVLSPQRKVSACTPKVCIQKERLHASWDGVQSCDLRRTIRSLSFPFILHQSRFNSCFSWNAKGTESIKHLCNKEEKQRLVSLNEFEQSVLKKNCITLEHGLAHSGFFQSTSTMLSTPLVSSFTRTRLCCCCMAFRNLDNCWNKLF